MKQPQTNVGKQCAANMLDKRALLMLDVKVALQLIDKTSLNLVSHAEELLAPTGQRHRHEQSCRRPASARSATT